MSDNNRMDPASLALAVVGVIEICYKYGKKLVVLGHQYQTLDKDLGETILTIQASWLKIDLQLRSLKAICDKLDYPLLALYHDALTRLEAKLSKASESFQVIQAKAGMAFHVHQKLKVVYLKRELNQTVSDFEEWQRKFDPSWYLITRIANPDVDRQLQNVRAVQHALTDASPSPSPPVRLARMRESVREITLAGAAEAGESVFKNAALISSDMVRVEGTNAYLSTYKNTTRRALLDPANFLAAQSQSQIPPATAKLNTRDLARLLQNIDPPKFSLLRCDGVIELPIDQESQKQFHLLFEIPDSLPPSTPKTLRTLLSETPKCSLSQRIQLSKHLARSVMFVHAAGFVHKNIRPETILIFPDEKPKSARAPAPAPDLRHSFLIGFSRIRKAEGQTDKFGDLNWEKNLYRHPLRQGLQPEDIFEMRHDIYSLGVCLLEIALWQSFVYFGEEGKGLESVVMSSPWPGLGLGITAALADRDQRRGAFAIKDRLVEICTESLPGLVGERLTGVVIACLSCLDDSAENPFRDDKSLQDRDGIVVGVRYIENVLLKLEELLI